MLLRRCPDRRNRTGEIVEALRTAPDGSVIRFEPGIYDFFADDAFSGYFCPSCNKSSDKKVIFPVLRKKNITLDGGVFVPNISIGIPVLKSIRKVTDMFLDVHLMITQPVRYVEEFCDAGADLVTIHVEADFPENIQAAIDKIHAKGKKAGIVLKPKTTWEAVLPYIDQVELQLE